jgi:hypothetical protein
LSGPIKNLNAVDIYGNYFLVVGFQKDSTGSQFVPVVAVK